MTCNVGDHQTFDSLSELHRKVKAMKGRSGQALQWRRGLVVALACDLSDQVGVVRDGRQFAEERQIAFYETFAKTGYGCTGADFNNIVRSLLL